MRYRDVDHLTRSEAEALLESGNVEELCNALVSLSFYDTDGDWVLDQLSRFVEHPNKEVRALVATCVGHVARVHGRIEHRRAESMLDRLALDPAVAPLVDEAWADIEIFVGGSFDYALKRAGLTPDERHG